MPEPVVSIPITIRNRSTIATSAVNIPGGLWGCPIDLVVPWEVAFTADDRAKVTVGAQTGTCSFGRQVGLQYRMAHIRGIQVPANSTVTGLIETAAGPDPVPPAFSAGDDTFQTYMRTDGLPDMRFGHESNWRGPWRPTGAALSMTRQELVEDDSGPLYNSGRRVWKCWGRIPNTIVGGARNPAANSLMAMLWLYFYPESPLVKWELAVFYCDAKNGSYMFPSSTTSFEQMWLTVPERLEYFLKWYKQRSTQPWGRQEFLVSGRRARIIMDLGTPWAFGQGAQWTGLFRDQSRLPTANDDYRSQVADESATQPFQYWINAIAQRSVWEGKTPVWGVAAPPVPTSIANPLVYDGYTIEAYRRSMTKLNPEEPQPDPLFDLHQGLFVASGANSGQSGKQGDYGHGHPTMYWGFNADGNPDAVEYGYHGVLPLWGCVGKMYHQGPDEVPRTDALAPGTTRNPGYNRTDGSIYKLGYVGDTPDPDMRHFFPTSRENEYRMPSEAEAHLPFNWEDKTGRMRGLLMAGLDQGHSSNYGLLYAIVTTGSWALLEQMRAETTVFKYSTRTWPGDRVTILIMGQPRWFRIQQCLLNGYWADHDATERAAIVDHLSQIHNPARDNVIGWTGMQRWRNAATSFYAAPDQYVGYGGSNSGPNIDGPEMRYSIASMWQMGTSATAIKLAELTNIQSFKDHVWAAFYSYARYGCAYFDVHPEVFHLRRIGNNNEADRQAFKCPGWLLIAYVCTPGMTLKPGGIDRDGGSGWGDSTPYPNWIYAPVNIGGNTQDGRTAEAWNSAWNAAVPDEGLSTHVIADPGRGSCRHIFGRVDWDTAYGVAAVRGARLATALKPGEVDRNAFINVRTESVLRSWMVHYNNFTEDQGDNPAKWNKLIEQMDWVWPTSYKPGDTDPPRNFQILVQPAARGIVLGMDFSTSSEATMIDIGGAANQLAQGVVLGMDFRVQHTVPDRDIITPVEPERDFSGGTTPPSVRRPRPGTAFGPPARRRLQDEDE